MRRILAVLVVLCILAIAGYLAAFYLMQPSPQEVLQRMGRAYAQAQDYSAKSQSEMEYNVMGMDMSMRGPYAVEYKRPDKVRVKVEYGGMFGDMEVISDGVHSFARQSMMGDKWIKSEAEGGLSGMQSNSISPAGNLDAMGDGIHPFALLEGQDPLDDIEAVTMDAGKPWRPSPAYVLNITYEDGGTQELWVGKRDYLIERYEWKPSMDFAQAMGEMMAEREESGGGEGEDEGPAAAMAEQMSGMMGDMQIELSETFEEVQINTGLDDSLFVFEPAEGEEVVTQEEYMAEMRESVGMPEGDVDLVGQPAPNFTATDLAGNEVSPPRLKGKPVLFDFWASWCAPCMMELPHIQEIHEEYSPKGLQVVGISSDTSKAEAQKTIDAKGITFPIVWLSPMDADGMKISTDYGVVGIPHLVLIDDAGIVRSVMSGYHAKEQLEEELTKVGL